MKLRLLSCMFLLVFFLSGCVRYSNGEPVVEEDKVEQTEDTQEADETKNEEVTPEQKDDQAKEDEKPELTNLESAETEYVVGEDINPGDYIVATEESMGGNFAVFRGDEVIFNDILGNELEPPLMLNDVEVSLEKGDTLQIKSFENPLTFTPIN